MENKEIFSNTKAMKALSIKQPWASLIAHGIKNIENRTWKTKFRGRIFIHASSSPAINQLRVLNEEQYLIAQKHFLKLGLNKFSDLPISAIIGEVDIVDCVVNHPSIWADYTSGFEDNGEFVPNQKTIYNWVLANPVLYDKPILNVKWKLSFWKTDYCHCEVCQKPFHTETMILSEDNWICEECLNEDLAKIEEM